MQSTETEISQWDEAPPQPFEEEAFDILAFELWQRANHPEMTTGEDWPDEEEARRSHASCL
jgi:hypothetical protein